MKICVDSGHGGIDSGAKGKDPFEFKEKEFNLKVSLLLKEQLASRGHSVIMTRRADRTLGLYARTAFANRYHSDFFISIHANAASNPTAKGMEIFHLSGAAKAQFAASQILESMLAKFPDHKNRGVKEANFTVLRLTLMPAILVECEFLTNPEQLQFLADPDNQRSLAEAIANGVTEDII